jgi:hypothetical protein
MKLWKLIASVKIVGLHFLRVVIGKKIIIASGIKMKQDETKIEEQFNYLIENSTDDEFWEYTRSWFSVETILDIMKNWNIETKEQAITELKDICKKNKIIAKEIKKW